MKKVILLFNLFLVLQSFSPPESLYQISITDINGQEISMSTLKGKHILIVILPGQINDKNAAFLFQLGQAIKLYSSKFMVVGVPSNEDGFTNNNAIKNWYVTNLGNQMIITGGMNTSISPIQSPLFSWLSSVEKNGHFNEEKNEIGKKFFIDKDGELDGVFGAIVPLKESLIRTMLAM